MTEQELLIWIAGFFDGEGCVSLSRSKRKDSHNYSYTMSVSVTQKEIEPLIEFHTMFGGNLHAYQVRGVEYWRWHCWGDIAKRFLQAIVPFLILKRERAEIAVEFQKRVAAWNKDFGRRGYPSHVLEAREEYFNQMRTLNKRGVSTTNPRPKTPGVKAGSKNYFKNLPNITSERETLRVQ